MNLKQSFLLALVLSVIISTYAQNNEKNLNTTTKKANAKLSSSKVNHFKDPIKNVQTSKKQGIIIPATKQQSPRSTTVKTEVNSSKKTMTDAKDPAKIEREVAHEIAQRSKLLFAQSLWEKKRDAFNQHVRQLQQERYNQQQEQFEQQQARQEDAYWYYNMMQMQRNNDVLRQKPIRY